MGRKFRRRCALPAFAFFRCARTNEQVGDVFEAASGLVSVEKTLNLAQHFSRCGTDPADLAADQRERKVGAGKISHRTQHADARDFGRPSRDVVDIDQADVEVDEGVLHGEVRIDRGERQTRELLCRAYPYPFSHAVEFGPDHLAGGAGHMAVGERVDLVSIAHQATDRGHEFLALNLRDDRVARADIVERKAYVSRLYFRSGFLGCFNNANRDASAVRHEDGARHHFTRPRCKFLRILPLRHEHEDAWPGIRPDFRIIEPPNRRAVDFLFVVRPAVPHAYPIAPDGGGRDVRMSHQMDVKQIPRRDEIEQGQVGKTCCLRPETTTDPFEAELSWYCSFKISQNRAEDGSPPGSRYRDQADANAPSTAPYFKWRREFIQPNGKISEWPAWPRHNFQGAAGAGLTTRSGAHRCAPLLDLASGASLQRSPHAAPSP